MALTRAGRVAYKPFNIIFSIKQTYKLLPTITHKTQNRAPSLPMPPPRAPPTTTRDVIPDKNSQACNTIFDIVLSYVRRNQVQDTETMKQTIKDWTAALIFGALYALIAFFSIR